MRPGGLRAGRWATGVAAPLHALRRTVHDPPVLRLQLAWSLSVIGSWTVTVALAVVAYDAGGTPAVSLAVLARTLPGLLVGPLLGALISRTSTSACLIAAAAVAAVCSAGAALARSSLVAVVALVTLVAVATMMFRAAQSAVLPELVDDPTELTAANMLSSAVEAAGLFAGPALAGVLLAVAGPAAAFATAAGFFAAAALLLVRRPVHRDRGARRSAPQSGGLRALLALPAARLLLLLVVAQTVLSGALATLYPALAVDVLDSGSSAVGLLTAAFGLGGLLVSVGLFALAGSRRLGLLTAGALVLWTVPLLAVPLLPHLAAVVLLLAVAGGGNALFDVTCVTLLQRAVPAAQLGRAFGWLETAAVLGLGAGAAAAAPLEAAVGPAAALALLAALLLLGAVAVVRPLRQLDRSLTAPVRQVAVLRALEPFAVLPTLEVERLALQLVHVTVLPGEAVVRQGERGTTYFVVEQGELEVDVDGSVVTHLHAGDSFGEIALLREGVRTATVTAQTPADLWSLDGKVFLAALQAGSGRPRAAFDEVASAHLRRAAPRGPVDHDV